MNSSSTGQNATGREAKRQRTGSPSRDQNEHNNNGRSASGAATHNQQTQAQADLEWYRSNRYQPGGALSVQHLHLVRLFVKRISVEDISKERTYRPPKDILRLLFFDPNRFVGKGIDVVHIERTLIKSMLWQCFAPDRRLPDNLSRALAPSAELREVMRQFVSWPSSESDVVSIDNALQGFDVSLEDLAEAIGSNENVSDPLDGIFGCIPSYSALLEKMADWFVPRRRNEYKWRLWQNKILALAVTRIVFKEDQDAIMEVADVTPSIDLLEDIPSEVLVKVVAYMDSASCPRFGAASKACRALVRSVPETHDLWRKNVFYATASDFQSKWRWSVMPFEETFASKYYPSPYYSPIERNGKKCPVEGKFLDCKLGGRDILNDLILAPYRMQSNQPRLRVGNKVRPSCQNSTFQYACTSPFATPTNQNMVVIRGFPEDHSNTCVVSLVGFDNRGPFIGLGVGRHSRSPDYPCLTELTVCIRFLDSGDIYNWTPLSHLLQHTESFLENNSYVAPWNAPFMKVDSSQRLIRQRGIPLHSSTPIAGFSLNLSLSCDIPDFCLTCRSIGHDLPGCILKAWAKVGTLRCCNCGCVSQSNFGASDEGRELWKHLFELQDGEDDACVEMSDDYSNKEDGSMFDSTDIPFCDSTCLSRFLARNFRECMVEVETNLHWMGLCYGCGTTCDYARAGDLEVFYANSENEDFSYDDWISMIWDTTFCSKDCFYRSLLNILDFLREEWRNHPYTVGFRDRYFLRLPHWLGAPKDYDTFITNLLCKEGWKCKEGELGHRDWVWDGSCTAKQGSKGSSKDISSNLPYQERIDSMFPRVK